MPEVFPGMGLVDQRFDAWVRAARFDDKAMT